MWLVSRLRIMIWGALSTVVISVSAVCPVHAQDVETSTLDHAIDCQADWDGDNTCVHELQAPDGYQACRLSFNLAVKNNNADYTLSKAFYFVHDTELPPRFLGYRITMHAKGSQKLFDRYGSSIRLDSIELGYVPSSQTNHDKFDAGCHFD